MPNESANNNNSWLQKLKQATPAAFDKEAAWDKLQERLEKKQTRRSVVLFRWAAAVLVIASGLLYWLYSNNQKTDINIAVKPVPVSGKQINTAQPLSAPAAESANKSNPSSLSLQTAGEKKELAIKQHPTITPAQAASVQQTEISIVKEQQQPQTIFTEELQTNPPATVATALLPKPKLKVVHNNEVIAAAAVSAQSEAPAQSMASRTGLPGFKKPVYVSQEREPEEIQTAPIPRKKILAFGSITAGKEE